ncbi:MAG TPA: hypothetical protein VFZ21_04365 [Gemmatimonadaceae bacterium]|jgi:hypothetical protein|nr:hypothetical protein [Gemmatimonadaceae bacterium]
MNEYFVGVEDHYAWANLVSIYTHGADVALLDRRRVTLLDPRLPAAPYHHDSRHLSLPEAEQLVLEVGASANDHAAAALSALLDDLAPAACGGLAIRVPPLPRMPASAAEALGDARVMNRADGMIYHDALTRAATQLGLNVTFFEKGNVLVRVAESCGTTAQELERRLKALGHAHGPPWRSGHVLACAGALLAQAVAARR